LIERHISDVMNCVQNANLIRVRGSKQEIKIVRFCTDLGNSNVFRMAFSDVKLRTSTSAIWCLATTPSRGVPDCRLSPCNKTSCS
jgi:hypothetical protein